MESTPLSSTGSLSLSSSFIFMKSSSQGTILDFDFDPFNTNRVVCANEDGTVKVWLVPEGGLNEQVNIILCKLFQMVCLKGE